MYRSEDTSNTQIVKFVGVHLDARLNYSKHNHYPNLFPGYKFNHYHQTRNYNKFQYSAHKLKKMALYMG